MLGIFGAFVVSGLLIGFSFLCLFFNIKCRYFRQRTLSLEEIRTIDKHPAFKLILDFVTNDSYSHER